MFRLVLVLSIASQAVAVSDSARSCKSSMDCETHGSSMISTHRVMVTAPGIVEDYSAAILADAPDALMLAADDQGVVIEEEEGEGTGSQRNSASTLTPPSYHQSGGAALLHAYCYSAAYYACILVAGFLLSATIHGLRQAVAERMVRGSDMDSVDMLQCCRDIGSEEANETDAFGCTPLHLAAHAGSADDVRALLAANADVNVREAWEEAPLHFAARAGNADICASLLEFGADANVLNASGCTPLVEAARAGKRASCSILLDQGGHAGGISDEQLPPMLSMLLLGRIVAGSDSAAAHITG